MGGSPSTQLPYVDFSAKSIRTDAWYPLVHRRSYPNPLQTESHSILMLLVQLRLERTLDRNVSVPHRPSPLGQQNLLTHDKHLHNPLED